MVERHQFFQSTLTLTALVLIHLMCEVDGCTVDGGQFLQVLQVKEEHPIGAAVGHLMLDNPSEVKKLSVGSANPYIDLVLDDDGKGASFIVSKRMDVDTGLNRLQLMYVDCTKQGGLKLQIEVEFEISDVNDHYPLFQPTNLYNFSITERAPSGTQVGVVVARDRDIKNTYVQYELVPDAISTLHSVQNLFKLRNLGTEGAAISLVHSLDYESQNSYTLHIIAKDCQMRRNCQHLQKTSTATVTVRVENVDDHNPEFDQANYRVSLSQDVKNNELAAQVTASDKDDGSEPIKYSLSGDGSEYFNLDELTGQITVQDNTGLVAGEGFILQVKAVQKSDPSKKDVAMVYISIIPADWDKPKFTERTYVTSISEYTAVNNSVLSMAINYNLQRQPLVVQMVEAQQDFHFITKHVGNKVDLILSEKVDYEQQRVHRMYITASNDQYDDQVEVIVNILNENDNNPDFDQTSYSFNIPYSEQGIVGKVTAYDADSSDEEIKYRFLPSEVSALFSLNSTGYIRFDKEQSLYDKDSYTLVVEASDSGKPSRSTNVVVTITFPDANAAAINEEQTESSNDILSYVIIGSVTLVVAVTAGVSAYFISRKVQARNIRKRRNIQNGSGQPTDDSNFVPLCTEQHRDTSSLGLMSVVNGRHENTYRNMSDLSEDEKYRTCMWKSSNGSLTELPEADPLLNQRLCEPVETSTSSDSGRSSGVDSMSSHTHHRSQSNPEATCSFRGVYGSPTTPKRGFISSYLEDHKRRRSGVVPPNLDQGFLVAAPEEFRSTSSSRPASIAESTHSNYAVSNTSDYGSNTVSSETNYNSRANKTIPLVDSLTTREYNSMEPMLSDKSNPEANVIIINSANSHRLGSMDSLNESANRKPFTTFHGDIV